MTDMEHLKNFCSQWDTAMVSNDAVAIGSFMSDEWNIVGADGITSKPEFLQSIASGVLTHNRMDSDFMEAKVYGDTGVVIARGTSAGTYKGEDFNFYEWSTSVFMKNMGKWYCITTMVTPAPNELRP